MNLSSIKSYSEAVRFIEGLSNIAPLQKDKTQKQAKERLENVKRFLKFLGNPEKKLKIIHIAGTSGKGSVVQMLHSILQAGGKKVGSYTSPHTTTFCERFKINDKYISEKQLVNATNFLKEKMDEYIAPISNFQFPISLSFFEASFVIAVLYFSKQNCDYAIIETGCGGRYDSSNAIEKPIYTIITNIGKDHLDIFGTMENLAKEKAGIIKPNVPILTGENDLRFLKIFRKELRMNNELRIMNYGNLRNIKTNLDGTRFEYKDEKYELQMVGEHQAKNAVLAIECAKFLGFGNPRIKKGLERAFYPARMEIISKNPIIILDGAHNEDKLKSTIDFLQADEEREHKFANPQGCTRAASYKKYLILGMAKNKEANKAIPQLFKFFDIIYLTRFSNPFRKVMTQEDFTKFAKSSKKKLYYKHYAKDALLDILPKLRNNDLLVVTGSIFLAGELRECWYSEEYIIKNRKSI